MNFILPFVFFFHLTPSASVRLPVRFHEFHVNPIGILVPNFCCFSQEVKPSLSAKFKREDLGVFKLEMQNGHYGILLVSSTLANKSVLCYQTLNYI